MNTENILENALLSSIFAACCMNIISCNSSNKQECYFNPYYGIEKLCISLPESSTRMVLDSYEIQLDELNLYLVDTMRNVFIDFKYGFQQISYDSIKSIYDKATSNIHTIDSSQNIMRNHIDLTDDYYYARYSYFNNNGYSLFYHNDNFDKSVKRQIDYMNIYCTKDYFINMIVMVEPNENVDSLLNLMEQYQLTEFNQFKFK